MKDQQCIDEILEFWFGELDEFGMCAPAQNKLWFQSSEAGDRHIRERFGAAVNAALAQELHHWRETGAGLVALVILLDQFTRNIFRGSAAAFAGDLLALELVTDAVEQGQDRDLPSSHRVFLYIPYEHAEDLAIQEAGIRCFDQLLADCDASSKPTIDGFRNYSVAHRDVIARFGRFPHRNPILNRDSTAEELAHMKQHGGF
jgi:uncharacterized protein (DUF924 family)